jgi:hypothetical protein
LARDHKLPPRRHDRADAREAHWREDRHGCSDLPQDQQQDDEGDAQPARIPDRVGFFRTFRRRRGNGRRRFGAYNVGHAAAELFSPSSANSWANRRER